MIMFPISLSTHPVKNQNSFIPILHTKIKMYDARKRDCKQKRKVDEERQENKVQFD